MNKELKLLKSEIEREQDESGRVLYSLSKTYYSYHCHDKRSICNLTPTVCRTIDRMNPFSEPTWQSSARECDSCVSGIDRVIEEVFQETH